MNPKQFFSTLAMPAKIALAAGVVAILLLTVGALWWSMAPRQQLLFGSLREADAAEIVQSLEEWKVPHTIIDGGTAITVPDDVVYATRMKLVSAGVPRGGHVGFELFNDSDFGVTEFAQRVNYQRALQGEIERTVSALPGVETARVHLTIRRPGLFVGEKETSKASVAVSLRPGETLTRQQVSGIRSLVASAVEGLNVDAVSVLDSDGALLAGTRAGAGLTDRDDEESRVEGRIQSRISDLLTQFLSREEFKVSVDATVNFDSVHRVSERLLSQGEGGNGLLVRKRTQSSDTLEGKTGQSQEDAEFAHGTSREEVSQAPGVIERLSVAVILPPGLSEVEVDRIRPLIAAAAGLETERGDRLAISRMGRFERWQSAPEAVPSQSVSNVPQNDLTVRANKNSFWAGPLKWVLVLAVGLLIGVVGAFAALPRTRKLKAAERDAVLTKLRGWLAEGGAAP